MRKWSKGKRTLAIGDGVNDVAMIQKAHVGIGIMGKEGNQASAFADYAIPRFMDLRRILFWHGRAFGIKLSNFGLWCIFKASIGGCSVWFYNFTNAMSGHHPVDDLYWSMYSVCLTNLALAFMIVWDHDINFSKYSQGVAAEVGLPFKMSGFYAMCRDEQKRFLYKFVALFFYGWWCSFVMYLVYF